MNEFNRTNILLTPEEVSKIKNAKIAVFGLGGVGGYALEALVRMGISNLIVIDGDTFEETNVNRQILALSTTIGRLKTSVAKERILLINPEANVLEYPIFINRDTINKIDFSFDYIVDCIDDVEAKILLIKEAKERNIPIISMMGAGSRLHASFKVSDIYKSEGDPLAKKMRQRLREEDISSLKVVYTDSPALPLQVNSSTHKIIVGSISYVVGMAGLSIAEEVIKDIVQ